MNCSSTKLAYKQTGYFSSLIVDYLDDSPALSFLYEHRPTIDGCANAIKNRQQFPTERKALVEHLSEQYKSFETSALVHNNIASLGDANTFTVCTAHQPALFTGTLYFIYKILHAIKLARHLEKEFPGKKFVPVYWMGSEDADLDELGKFYLGTEKIVWDTKQTGAVGRMNTKGIDKLLNRIEGELVVQPFGKELIDLLKLSYAPGTDIQTATFTLLNQLFKEHGLVVLIPDSRLLKSKLIKVFEEDLFHQTASKLVSETIEKFPGQYKVQATPREINLFYLKESVRGRIERVGDRFIVHDTNLSFSADEIKNELAECPERFSPNVILRGLFQETILPNIAFVGGGGETAYWLELRTLFQHFKTPYPVLVLRNSFLLVENKWKEKIERMGFGLHDFFQSEQALLNKLVARNKNGELRLEKEKESAHQLYELMKSKVSSIDPTLAQHVEALQAKALKPLQELEKKMLLISF
jgi:bacillithiol synthase